MQNPLDEQTKLTLPIKSWWLVFSFVGLLATGYWSLKADTDAALKLSRETANKQEQMSGDMYRLQMNIQSITDNVKYFREQYERDMNKFIREQPEKGRR